MDAQYHLAQMYETGAGVERSFPKARMWYSIAVLQGDGDSLGRLITF